MWSGGVWQSKRVMGGACLRRRLLNKPQSVLDAGQLAASCRAEGPGGGSGQSRCGSACIPFCPRCHHQAAMTTRLVCRLVGRITLLLCHILSMCTRLTGGGARWGGAAWEPQVLGLFRPYARCRGGIRCGRDLRLGRSRGTAWVAAATTTA